MKFLINLFKLGNIKKYLIIILVITSTIGLIGYQYQKIDNLNNQVASLTTEKEKVEFQRDSMVKAVGEMTKDINSISRENRRIRDKLREATNTIWHWESMGMEALANPELDSKMINTYFNSLFKKFECKTGGKCDE